jgi:hypothetical protein
VTGVRSAAPAHDGQGRQAGGELPVPAGQQADVALVQVPGDRLGQRLAAGQPPVADSVSSSWAICEDDAGAAYVQAENTIFRQMAAQGQAVFGGDGDTGAFGCIRSDGTTILNLIDPPSQPWVTAVGGTSFEIAPFIISPF